MAERRPDRTLGPLHDDFWAYCAQGELHLQRCRRCRELAWPVVRACESCGNDGLDWEKMSGRGRIVSWCTFERDYNRGLLPVPWDTILVELEEGALFISNPEGLTNRDVRFEMPVEVTFRDCEDSAGPFALPVFRAA